MKVFVIHLLLFCCLCSNLKAQNLPNSNRDTIFLSIDNNEKALVQQELKAGMTLYQMSRSLQTPVKLLLDFNPALKIDDIPIGTQIQVPFTVIKERLVEKQSELNTRTVVAYRVRAKENLFRISKIYLGMDIKTIMNLNQMKRKSLAVNEVLVVGYLEDSQSFQTSQNNIAQNAIADTLYESVDTVGLIDQITFQETEILDPMALDSVREMRTPFDIYKEENKIIRKDRGVAFWDKTQYERQKLYVLHTTAKKNTLVEITNPMNGRKVYAKVVGNIPSKSYTTDIKMVVSPAVADALRVLDSRFYISYRYIE